MIIAISGKKQSGKDIFAKIYQQTDEERRWELKSFAGALKDICGTLLGVPHTYFESNAFKESKDVCAPIREQFPHFPSTPRQLLIHQGNEIKDSFGDKFIAYMLLRNYRPDKDNWIITDLRFDEEIAVLNQVAENKLVLVRMEREKLPTDDDDRSETCLDFFPWEHKIMNDQKLVTLFNAAKDLKQLIQERYDKI